MEDDAGRAAAPARDAADAVLQIDAMPAARAALRAVMRRDDRGVALVQRDDARRGLRARPLLDEDELAAVAALMYLTRRVDWYALTPNVAAR